MSQYKVYDDQTLIDIAISSVNSLDNLYSILLDNNLTDITGILDINIPIECSDSYIKEPHSISPIYSRVIDKPTFDDQSVFDTYLQFNNNLDGIFNFLSLNNFNLSQELNLEKVIISRNYNNINNNTIYCTKLGRPLGSYLKLENDYYVLFETNYKIIINNG